MKAKALWAGLIAALAMATGVQASEPPWRGGPVDYSIYARLLSGHVQGGAVDYKGLKAKEKELDRFLGLLAKVDAAKLGRASQMAFYINAYNAWTIKLILRAYPGVESIKDLGGLFTSPWKKEIVRLWDGVHSLDYIEHEVLRPRFKDARVHFAVNCASKGCPPLAPEPYLGPRLGRQLDQAAKRFINDPKQTYLKGGNLYVSRIFKWFPEDFDDDPKAYILRFAMGDLKKALLKAPEAEVEYLDYDWSLNGK